MKAKLSCFKCLAVSDLKKKKYNILKNVYVYILNILNIFHKNTRKISVTWYFVSDQRNQNSAIHQLFFLSHKNTLFGKVFLSVTSKIINGKRIRKTKLKILCHNKCNYIKLQICTFHGTNDQDKINNNVIQKRLFHIYDATFTLLHPFRIPSTRFTTS